MALSLADTSAASADYTDSSLAADCHTHQGLGDTGHPYLLMVVAFAKLEANDTFYPLAYLFGRGQNQEPNTFPVALDALDSFDCLEQHFLGIHLTVVDAEFAGRLAFQD